METRSAAYGFAPSGRWSYRLLLLSVLVILFLTLFPFHFISHARIPANRPVYLLGGRGKDPSALNVFLNVLLFVPCGFALSENLRERGQRWGARLGWALLAGCLFSYAIEFLQLYTAGRDSGWEDIITNGTGALLGSLLLAACGGWIIERLSNGERDLAAFLTGRRAAMALAIYFAASFGVSAGLQRQTRLANWHPDDLLTLGNNAAGDPHASWKGAIYLTQFWNRALPRKQALGVIANGIAPSLQGALLASYDFSTPHALQAQTTFLPGLSWTPSSPAGADPPYLALDGRSWLTSEAPVANLVNAARTANQFTIRAKFKPAEISGVYTPVISLSKRRPSMTDFEIGQLGTTLVVVLRNSLAGRHTPFVWLERYAILRDQALDLIFTYDGTTGALYLDNGMPPHTYRLGPGSFVGRLVHDVRPSALDLYACGYYFAVFFTGGVLSGIAGRNIDSAAVRVAFLTACALIPALFLEFVLIEVSGRRVSWPFTGFSIAMAVAGAVWINFHGRKIAPIQPQESC
jgi:hypothetical protein